MKIAYQNGAGAQSCGGDALAIYQAAFALIAGMSAFRVAAAPETVRR